MTTTIEYALMASSFYLFNRADITAEQSFAELADLPNVAGLRSLRETAADGYGLCAERRVV